jgi:hypothetical protein
MTFLTSGGAGTVAKLFNDLKVSVAFNHFTGDNFISTLFPSATKDADGNYVVTVYTPGGTGTSASTIIKSVTVESSMLSYVMYGALALAAVLLVWIFTRK